MSGGDDALTRPDRTDTADAALGGADRMLLDDKALLAVLALDDARRAIAEIGIDVAIPQVEWFEDVAVGVDDVVGTGHRHPFQSGRLPIILAPPVADDTAYV